MWCFSLRNFKPRSRGADKPFIGVTHEPLPALPTANILRNPPLLIARRGILGAVIALTAAVQVTAACLEPREIPLTQRNVAPRLEAATRPQPVERGSDRPLLDGIGWVVGIPRKIILWDVRVANHHVSSQTEAAIEEYLTEHELDHVKVRINQYAPVADWKRLRENTSVAWPYRYTLGAISVATEAVLPGRIFGRDYYNPYTATVHVYSDVPALAIKQACHSKDYTRRTYPGTYSLASLVPIVDLWPQAIATGDAIAYAERHGAADLEREEYRILYPAYGASVGGVVGDAIAGAFLPIYAGTIVAGHLVGRWEARRVDDASALGDAPFETALSSTIERLPTEAAPGEPSDVAEQLLDQDLSDGSMLAVIGNCFIGRE